MSVEEIPPTEPQKKTWKELRQVAGVTQKALAEATGIKLKTIQDLERGNRTSIEPVMAYRLAQELRCRPESLPVTIDAY